MNHFKFNNVPQHPVSYTCLLLFQEVMVRHEAAEAMGAIGDASVVEILKKYSSDKLPEVAETCQVRDRGAYGHKSRTRFSYPLSHTA